MDLREKIRVIEDFPKKGISFKDITTLFQDAEGFAEMSKQLIEVSKKYDFDLIAAPEARAFIIAAPIAYELKKGIVLVRKPGKLPGNTIKQEYALEYGTGELYMHSDAIKPGQRVLIVDDLIATGGSAMAAAQLVEKLGGIVSGFVFVSELTALGGRQVLKDYPVESLVEYDDVE
ncbi:MAG: adenine phosphoribosyltransferase [Clostridia bacterium]|nr:adenine phosphoribosyltransferase [Clostridia bacterium]